jgi:hypothetical protein
METSMRQLANRIHAAKKASEGLAEAFPSGQRDPWEKYEFHHEGKKIGHKFSPN